MRQQSHGEAARASAPAQLCLAAGQAWWLGALLALGPGCGPTAPKQALCENIAAKMSRCKSATAASKAAVATACQKQLTVVDYDCQAAVEAFGHCVDEGTCADLVNPNNRCSGLAAGIPLYCTGSVRFEDPDRAGRFSTWFDYLN